MSPASPPTARARHTRRSSSDALLTVELPDLSRSRSDSMLPSTAASSVAPNFWAWSTMCAKLRTGGCEKSASQSWAAARLHQGGTRQSAQEVRVTPTSSDQEKEEAQ
eukprot:scaffold51981_cov22-Tisochrysis_lutea.AAC.1